MSRLRRIGIYGGTFDPIHIGHLAVAEEARAAFGLSCVIFVPASRQPLKGAQGASPEHRLAMTQLACADNQDFLVDELELERPAPSYTVDTLEELSERLGESAELWFVLGIDAARELPRWHQVERVLALTQLGVVGRPGYTLDLAAMERALPSIRDRVHQIDGLRLDISSTDLRSRLADGRPVRYQIPEPVRAYIAQHGLYRDDDSA